MNKDNLYIVRVYSENNERLIKLGYTSAIKEREGKYKSFDGWCLDEDLLSKVIEKNKKYHFKNKVSNKIEYLSSKEMTVKYPELNHNCLNRVSAGTRNHHKDWELYNHKPQKSTGSILNKINERYRCNSKKRSVPVMNLIRYHKPKQNGELINLIKEHQEGHSMSDCACGCKSAGTIEDFAQNLYKAYLDYCTKNEDVPYKNFEDCQIFMKHLFVINSLKGNTMEVKCLDYINNIDTVKDYNYTIEMANELYDFKYAIDIIVKDDEGNELMGIQVKPKTYLNFPTEHPVVQTNLRKNRDYGKKVIYIYYDKNDVIVDQDKFNKELINELNINKSKTIGQVIY